MARSKNPTAFGSMDDIRKIFIKFDKNGDGKISCNEVVENLSELGTKISQAEVQSIMQEFDKDGDGYIDLDEFVDFIQNGGLGDSGGNDGKELRDAFDLYDKNKNGLISADELHSVMRMLGKWESGNWVFGSGLGGLLTVKRRRFDSGVNDVVLADTGTEPPVRNRGVPAGIRPELLDRSGILSGTKTSPFCPGFFSGTERDLHLRCKEGSHLS